MLSKNYSYEYAAMVSKTTQRLTNEALGGMTNLELTAK
jgi:hypothetical protein